MKKILFLLLCMVLLPGCGKSSNIRYSQQVLPKPESIELRKPYVVVYEENSKKYTEIYEEIHKNWWKISEAIEHKINDENMKKVETLEDISIKTNMRYATEEQILLSFIYENNPIDWSEKSGKIEKITRIDFVLPTETEEDMNVKGIFTINSDKGNNMHNRIYTYYCSDDLFNAISEKGKVVKTDYRNSVSEISIDNYQEITVEKMINEYINNYAWTNLVDHSVFWNWEKEQVVINHEFSKTASNEELENARLYDKNIHFYRSRSFNTIGNSWEEVPEDAEVIIQVYKEKELVSQDIYSDVESGIAYKQVHYEK